MLALLDHPAVQGGAAPLVAALIVGLLLHRTRYAWLAIIAGYVTMIVLAGDFSFDPLTAGRKVVLMGFAAALAGVVLDALPHAPRRGHGVVAFIPAAASLWVFLSVLRQREGMAGIALAAGVALFVGALVWLVLQKRDDGLRAGATGLGLGLATGVAGVVSASIGYLLGGAALAAASGAMLLVQVITGRPREPGFTGTLTIGVLAAMFAAATLLLAQLPWYALPLLLLVPLATSLPIPARAPIILRAAIPCGYALVAASLTILAAWYGARGSFT